MLFGKKQEAKVYTVVQSDQVQAVGGGWQNSGFQSGGGMKPASAYNYSQEVIPGKFTDDWNYILNGDGGNPFSRAGDVFARDWGMASTGDKVDLTLSTVLPMSILYRGPSTLVKGKSYIDIGKFTESIKKGKDLMDPRTKYILSPTKGRPHSKDAVWKLIDNKGNRVGTFDSTGKYLRK